MQLAYGVALWYGAQRILHSRDVNPMCRYNPTTSGCYTGGTVVNCFFAVITAAFAVAGAVPFLGTIASATGAAARVFEVIDRQPLINAEDDSGLAPDASTLRGEIEFRDVSADCSWWRQAAPRCLVLWLRGLYGHVYQWRDAPYATASDFRASACLSGHLRLPVAT